jgi:hypothetical protein
LEVVVPSEAALQEFLGADYDIMQQIAAGNQEAAAPLISQFYRFGQGLHLYRICLCTNFCEFISLSMFFVMFT